VAPAAPSAGELDLFQAQMRRAVQAAAINPAAAELAHEAGIVRVRFVYQNGVASGITVTGSSGFPLLDQAAEQAVRDARLPPQPPDFAGRADQVQVDVIFRAAAQEIDGD
jgi:protein TonB